MPEREYMQKYAQKTLSWTLSFPKLQTDLKKWIYVFFRILISFHTGCRMRSGMDFATIEEVGATYGMFYGKHISQVC